MRLLVLFLMMSSCALISVNDTKGNIAVEDFRFYVAGHTYGSPGVVNSPFHPPFMDFLHQNQIDSMFHFGILTGDVVQNCDTISWSVVDRTINSLNHQVFIAPGNHDLKYPELYKERYGDTHYHFRKGKELFVFWDLLRTGWNIPKEYISEIQQLTSETPTSHLFIFTHHIPWYSEQVTPDIIPNSTYARLPYQTFYTEILEDLTKLELPIYLFAGDVGANKVKSELRLHRSKNVHMLCSGMGSGEFDNVLDVQVQKGGVTISATYLNNNTSFVIDSLYREIE